MGTVVLVPLQAVSLRTLSQLKEVPASHTPTSGTDLWAAPRAQAQARAPAIAPVGVCQLALLLALVPFSSNAQQLVPIGACLSWYKATNAIFVFLFGWNFIRPRLAAQSSIFFCGSNMF